MLAVHPAWDVDLDVCGCARRSAHGTRSVDGGAPLDTDQNDFKRMQFRREQPEVEARFES